MAFDPTKFYEIMFGKSEDQQDYAVFKNIADDLLDAGTQAGAVLGQYLRATISKHDPAITDAYVLFVLNSEDSFWPPLTPALRDALKLGESLLRYAGDTPNSQFQMPTSEMEMEVDKILIELAKWCDSQMSMLLVRKYMGILKKYDEMYSKLHPDLDPKVKTAILRVHFEKALRDKPNAFQRPGLVQQIIRAVDF